MRVAVLGGAGFVGRCVCDRLHESRDLEVTVVTRTMASSWKDAPGGSAPGAFRHAFDVVLNLAYPNEGPPRTFSAANRQLCNLILSLKQPTGRVIQVSTLAVFGLSLDAYPIAADVVPRRRDQPYVEVKLELEHLLMSSCRGSDLHVVRLGNVWGPASPLWTAGFADRLLFGEPCSVTGYDGFSNVTDVHNVAAYLAALVTETSFRGLTFHHLAEFSGLRWSFWIQHLGKRLQEPVVEAAAPMRRTWTVRRSLAGAVRGALDALKRKTLTESALRSVLARVPDSLLQPVRQIRGPILSFSEPLIELDADLAAILACQREFKSQLPLAGVSFIDANESLVRTNAWLETAGYGLLAKTDPGAR